jgi:hypothetical protein
MDERRNALTERSPRSGQITRPQRSTASRRTLPLWPDSCGNGPLWHDENSTSSDCARHSGVSCRKWRYCEQCTCWSDSFRRGCWFCRGRGEAREQNRRSRSRLEFFQFARPSSLLKRFATIDEIAALATCVASELASATNGAPLRADGGAVRAIL